MSIVIALIVVLIVGALVANFYPKSKPTVFSQEETSTPKPESFVESSPKVVVEEPVVATPKVEAPKMVAKPKKKPQPKKKPIKAKINA